IIRCPRSRQDLRGLLQTLLLRHDLLPSTHPSTEQLEPHPDHQLIIDPSHIGLSAFPFHTGVEREHPFSGARREPWWKRCRFHHGSRCNHGSDHNRARGFRSTQNQRLWLVRTDTRSAAVGEESNKSPTCSLVPRKGSSVGTRCRESWS